MVFHSSAAIEDIVSPERARFDTRERRVYSHDTGVLPGAFQPLAGPSLADGVAQPETEDQVVRLVRYARPKAFRSCRAARPPPATAAPCRRMVGWSLDLTRLKGIVWVDSEDLTVTVRAGTVWQDLEEALAAYGLALRLYPTSAPALDGWRLAGAGRRRHRQPRLRLVRRKRARRRAWSLATATIREVSGAELSAIADAEGTTGIITEVTLAVRRAAEQEPDRGRVSPTRSHMTDALRQVTAARPADLVDHVRQPDHGAAEERRTAKDAPGPP